ncbi:MAG TPA: membrane protein insertase YidC [Candidatus Limnocylindrales bacterium]|nr:membrane protein insertase YidC [Candidatus Limnocylindrales bacterium]
MDKRALIGITLSVLVLIAYQQFINYYYGAPPTDRPAPASVKTDAEKSSAPTPAAPTTTAVPGQVVPVEIASGALAKDLTVETDNYIATFTTLGARLKSFKFKKFRTSTDEKSPPFEIVSTAAGVPLPLGVRLQTPAPFEDSALVYAAQAADLKLTGAAQGTLVFQGQTSSGTVITKTLTFSGATYSIGLEVGVKSADEAAVVPEVLLTDKSDHTVPNHDAPFEGYLALIDNKIKREPAAEAIKGHEFSGEVSWAGFGHTYFFIALIPDNGAQQKISVHQAGAALVSAISGPAGSGRYTLFVGPKEINLLESVGKGMERSIDFGYFGFISKPLLYVLHFFHRLTSSYGVDIIILTMLIKLLLWPVAHKSMVSMKSMQKLAPQMEKLKEKFGDDKEKLNREIMELYKRNGVNPLGGCLPMVLQFPVFIGLYNALSTPIELRHAPFMWIKDLSRPDWQSLPFTLGDWHLGIPILTILMGGSMFLQQWMTPSAGDPNQRKMMMLMPLMFTFMFVSFPAGLTVYWLVNNVLSIVQQYWINRVQK